MAIAFRAVFVVCLLAASAGLSHAQSTKTVDQPAELQHAEEASDLISRRRLWEQFIDAGPLEPGDIYAVPLLQELTETYKLDATQAVLVRSEIDALVAERRAAMGPLAVERDALANSAANIWWNYREAALQADDSIEPRARFRDDPEYQGRIRRIDEIDQQHRIDWDAVLTRIEARLPPDQASRGRMKFHTKRIERAARRVNIAAIKAADPAAHQDSTVAAAIETAVRDSQSQLRQEVLAEAMKAIETQALEPDVRKRLRESVASARKSLEANPETPNPADATADPIARNFDRWEAYTRDFIDHFQLNENQQASAISIMTELRARAEALDSAQKERESKLRGSNADPVRRKTRATVDRRIEGLFGQLQRRLESLLTIEQRQSKPIANTTQPAETRG